jgi:selenocysteine-specific elongation factor
LARLLLEHPLVARGGDRFVLRSFSPVTTIGGGIVLDPFPPKRPRVSERGLAADTARPEAAARLVEESGLNGVRTGDLAVRLGILPGEASRVIDAAGKGVLRAADLLVGRRVLSAEVDRLAGIVAAHHEAHPFDAGLSLQALRAAVGDAGAAWSEPVLALLVEHGVRKQAFELGEGGAVVRRPGWKAALEAHAGDAGARLARCLADARWEVPTVAELQRQFPDLAVAALLAHLAREGGVEQIDQERYAAKGALDEFRRALEDALQAVGQATPAALRDRFGLTRKYLIPLLEWADRRGITRRQGDTRVLARLTGATGGS